MAGERLLLRDAIGGFAPGQVLRAALLLTFSFDGAWLEEGLIPDLFDRQVDTALVIRDGNAIIREAPSVRYHRANAQYSRRVFHPKLILLVADDRAVAVIGSANLTRGGLERNLELASVYEVSPEGGPKSLFEKLQVYLEVPLMQEVRGSAAADLVDTYVALSEVLKNVPKEGEEKQIFLHNYERSIWDQVLAQLPHRYVHQVTIVSPFFEPNHEEPEEPGMEAGDDSIFGRLFADLKFEQRSGIMPVNVYFQQSEGKTQLPLDTMRKWAKQIDLRQRLATSNDPRPLHAKLLIIEGAQGPGLKPYIIIVHGSPNFTTAALMSSPPKGNAEIAVLTWLPWKRDCHKQVRGALHLDSFFGEVQDWNLLYHDAPKKGHLPGLESFRIGDVLFRVADSKLFISWRGNTLGAKKAFILIEINGSWVSIGSVELSDVENAELNVPDLINIDKDGLLSLQATRIRVELRDNHGNTLTYSYAPINVDFPANFCGLAMVEPLIATLDEQIAHAGCGVPTTYREHLKFLEQHRTKRKISEKEISVLTHQADLDRFFRNLHFGFKGLRSIRETLPDSEYTLRRTFKDLGRWCHEAIQPDSKVPTFECRIFLVDRLAREIQRLLQAVAANPKLSHCLGKIVDEFEIAKRVEAAAKWERELVDRRIDAYVSGTVKRLRAINNKLREFR